MPSFHAYILFVGDRKGHSGCETETYRSSNTRKYPWKCLKKKQRTQLNLVVL